MDKKELENEITDEKDTSTKIAEEKKDSVTEDKKEDTKEEKKDTSKDKYKDFYENEEPYVVTATKKSHKALKVVLLSLLSIILLVYLGGVIYYSMHFAGKTTLNSYDISGKSLSSAQDAMDVELAKYEINIDFKNGTEKLVVGDGNIQVKLEDSMKAIRKRQNAWLWPFNLFDEYNFKSDYVVSYDETALKDKLNTFSYMDESNMESSVNARVRMENGEVVILPDETGTKLDKELVYSSVCNALDKHQASVNLDALGCYIIADVTVSADTIAKGVENAKAFLETDISYDFNGYMIPISKEDLCSLAYIDGNGNIQISKNNVEAYARQFARDKSTCNTYRDFKTTDGRMIQVYGSWFGWELDEEISATDLLDAMQKVVRGENHITLTPAFTHEGYSYGEYNDIGDTYVEVDLGNQHIYMYVDGELIIESDCVSGNWSRGMSTPGGLYGFTGKGYRVTLIGEDYETPVTYWMPFNGGIGLHDATWRYSFGGSIYLYDGSHGCVNLPYSVAATIYENMEVGMPVVCYWE